MCEPSLPPEEPRAAEAARGPDGGTYLFVLPVALARTGPGRFAVESAFAEHLRLLRRRLQPEVGGLVLACPTLAPERLAATRAGMIELDEAREGIRFLPTFPADAGLAGFWTSLPSYLPDLLREVRRARVVHAGISYDLKRPLEFPTLLLARLLGKATIAVEDTDLRQDALMNYRTGRWSKRTYLVNRHIYDRVRSAQLAAVARFASLSLFKGRSLVEDFGGGSDRVKDFLDSAYFTEQIITPEALRAKQVTIRRRETPLRLIYFGRLTAYKGVDHCLRALARARTLGLARAELTILGGGEEEPRLRRLAAELSLQAEVTFAEAVPFGPALFERLYQQHVLLAAPLSGDTPRSALDGLAAGLAIAAYDTPYYRDLARSGAVALSPWADPDALGALLVELDGDRARLVGMLDAALAFARENTQELWIERRVTWTKALLTTAPGDA